MEAYRGRYSGLKVIFDSSFLIYICEKPSTLLSEMEEAIGKVEPLIPKPVLRELKALARRKRSAVLALEKAEKMEVVGCKGPADEAIVKLAKDLGLPVATLDLKLASLLRKEGIAYFTAKDDHLVTVGRPALR